MADFMIAYQRRKPIEGGWDGDPDDSGNWTSGKRGVGNLSGTNFGITAYEYSVYKGHEVSVNEMKNMPEKDAIFLFKKNYWDKIKGDDIKDQGLANDIYDAAVNQGVITAIREIQQSSSVVVTGIMDDSTINKLNNV